MANAKPPVAPRPWWDPRFLVAALALVGIILLGALIIAWLDRWRKRSGPQPFNANDQLAHFRELYEQGELSQEEFERIRVRLTAQLRQEWDVPGGTSTPAAPESPKPTGPDQPAS
jgi:hypothetical protein